MEKATSVRIRRTESAQIDEICYNKDFANRETKKSQSKTSLWLKLRWNAYDLINKIELFKQNAIKKYMCKVDFLCKVLGICFLVIVIFKYSNYLEMLHENDLWFTNIKEVEREISFRTEQGLYYSYYKQLVYASSITEGIKNLMHDNSTEHGHILNALNRFNIFQEVVLAVAFRMLSLKLHLKPIFFYIKSVFFLNGLGLGIYFLTSWYLSKSLLAGVMTVLFYVVNKTDTTRVYYTIPLRESFSLPFLSAQTLLCVVFMRSSTMFQKMKKWNTWLFFLTTFLFVCTWQFAQFVLLLQAVAFYVLAIVGLLSVQKVLYFFQLFLVSLLSVACLQFGQKMLLCSFVLSLIPVATLFLHAEKNSLFKNNLTSFLVLIIQLPIALICSYLLNCIVKFLAGNEDDEHIMSYLKVKVFQEEVNDFETKLYLCNPGFNFIDKDMFWRLSKTFVLPLYCFHLVFFIIVIILFIHKNQNQSISSNSIINYWLVSRPDVAYVTVFSVFLGVMALCTVRMKFLWLPYVCLLAPLPLTDVKFWKSKLGSLMKLFLTSITIALVAILGYLLHSIVRKEVDDLREFWDPDTVDLMEWIKKNTLPTSVFAGSMQLLAGVKLCTSRSITNHPHFENKWLRERTKQVYQIYARQSPERVYNILLKIGTTHIILEDSLCLSPREDCSLPKIMDNHISQFKNSKDKSYNIPLFCDEIRHMKPPYSKFFKLMFHNKTFRIYQLL